MLPEPPTPARTHSSSSDAPSCRLFKEADATAMCLRLRFAGKTTNQLLTNDKQIDAACTRLSKKLKLPARLVDETGAPVAGTCDAISGGHVLQIGDGQDRVDVPILLNPPSLWRVRVASWPHVGSPLMSEVRSQFAEQLEYRWYRLRRDAPTSVVSAASPALSEVATLVSSLECYTPVAEDVGHLLLVEVTAFAESATAGPVDASTEAEANGMLTDAAAEAPAADEAVGSDEGVCGTAASSMVGGAPLKACGRRRECCCRVFAGQVGSKRHEVRSRRGRRLEVGGRR